ncbi:hypothetical protein NSP_38460 [Nodularia spumigena CCY9414]|nr:hypothetical protein NSP_38460 [Nodularia spumigena CCY9414]
MLKLCFQVGIYTEGSVGSVGGVWGVWGVGCGEKSPSAFNYRGAI